MRYSGLKGRSNDVGFASDNPYLTEHRWEEVRDRIHALNPEFAAIVDEIGPDDKHTLFEVTYDYGKEFLQNGDFLLPSKHNELFSIKSDVVGRKIRERLDYNLDSNPIGFVEKNALELFITVGDRIIPFAMIEPGKIFGLWYLLDGDVSFCPRNFPWGITAGVRSIFMLPKISNHRQHQKLKTSLSLTTEKPENLRDHFYVFRELSNRNAKHTWQVKVFFFSKEWFSHQDDSQWVKLTNYYLKHCWHGTSYWRNQFIWEIIFSLIQTKRALKPSAYTLDIVKHLFKLSSGVVPGFQPAIHDHYAPVSFLQKMYTEIYGLEYSPTIVQPGYHSVVNKSRPVYYLMAYPTSFELQLKRNKKNTNLDDVYDACILLNKYVEEIIALGQDNSNNIKFYNIAKETSIKAFHSLSTSSRYINNSEDILKSDESFGNIENVPINASFFNGCFQITKKIS